MHRLIARHRLGEHVHALHFDRPAAEHTRPGQVVQITDPTGGRGYFALASAPGAPACLWVRPSSGTAGWLTEQPTGADVAPLVAIGNGFPLEPHADRPWLVLVTGTALAAVRALVEQRLSIAGAASITVAHGARSEADRPGAELLDDWSRRGICVLRTVSGAPRVQEVAAVALHDPRVAVYAAGPRGLMEDADRARAACGGDAVRRNA